jgi:type IV pilus biogenesis protein CpaD/CtpE
MLQQTDQFKRQISTQWGLLKEQASSNIQQGKTKLKQVQSAGVITLISTQIKTDVMIRQAANRLEHPKASALQSSLLDFSRRWMSIPINDYDNLNAKTAAKAIRQLRLTEVLRVQHYEKSNKNRKTVLQSAGYYVEKHRKGEI